jgi:hypothetical protein
MAIGSTMLGDTTSSAIRSVVRLTAAFVPVSPLAVVVEVEVEVEVVVESLVLDNSVVIVVISGGIETVEMVVPDDVNAELDPSDADVGDLVVENTYALDVGVVDMVVDAVVVGVKRVAVIVGDGVGAGVGDGLCVVVGDGRGSVMVDGIGVASDCVENPVEN